MLDPINTQIQMNLMVAVIDVNDYRKHGIDPMSATLLLLKFSRCYLELASMLILSLGQDAVDCANEYISE